MHTLARPPARLWVATTSEVTDNDTDPGGTRLATYVRDALEADPYVPDDVVKAEVRDHAVTLSGTVKWEHQRIGAERAVADLPGVHVLTNAIRVRPRAAAAEIRASIVSALHYGRSVADHRIDVDVDAESVTLTGAVQSYTDRQVAERTALAVPHVRTVHNLLQVVRA